MGLFRCWQQEAEARPLIQAPVSNARPAARELLASLDA
jgi:hypothetical protein